MIEEEIYIIDTSCMNCGTLEVGREIYKGTAVSEIDCDNCGCENLIHTPVVVEVVEEEEKEED